MLHCHCRFCTAPYFDDAEDAERVARGKESKTYTVPGNITYKEWEQKFVSDRRKADNDVIISNKQSGALNNTNDPDRSRRDAHAEREYTRIINNGKDVFVNKIAANTGLRKKLIAGVYDHVFINKHLLINGEGRFDPDFDMALSFQRLKEGSYKIIDIVLLRHEYLERAVEKRYNLTYEQAHNYAIKHFDYPRALLGRTKIASSTFRTYKE